ncbi:MAG TPA: hypothetical protein VN616_14685 [Puia sp.]|nr:hypothetical protein [Puia sp.]
MEKNDKRPNVQGYAERPVTDDNLVNRPNLSGQEPANAPSRPEEANRAEALNRAEEPNPITDPQESMEGPVSSFIQGIKHRAEKNDDEEQEEHRYKDTHTGGDFINK